MNPSETVKLVAIVAALWPSMKLSEHTPDAWHEILADLPAQDAAEAVKRLAKSRTGYIGPADIRREVFRVAGVLAPGVDDTFDAIMRVALNEGRGRSLLHPLAEQVYAALGGAPVLAAAPRWVARRDFEAAWARIGGEHDTRQLVADFTTAAAVSAKIRPEITAARPEAPGWASAAADVIGRMPT